jgi:type VI secretion system secreted protein VgrG
MSIPTVRTPTARIRSRSFALIAGLATSGLLLASISPASAADPVGLGTAESFAVLAGSGITNTGPTTITGDVGTFPTPTETGFSSVSVPAGAAVTQA